MIEQRDLLLPSGRTIALEPAGAAWRILPTVDLSDVSDLCDMADGSDLTLELDAAAIDSGESIGKNLAYLGRFGFTCLSRTPVVIREPLKTRDVLAAEPRYYCDTCGFESYGYERLRKPCYKVGSCPGTMVPAYEHTLTASSNQEVSVALGVLTGYTPEHLAGAPSRNLYDENGVVLCVTVFPDGHLILQEINSRIRERGYAALAMERLSSWLDAHRATASLKIGFLGADPERLRTFYPRFGFYTTGFGSYFRDPMSAPRSRREWPLDREG